MLDSVLRRLARDQWVRLHGTPRVTVLVGDERGREIWTQWLALSGTAGTLLECDSEGETEAVIDSRVRTAVVRAVVEPAYPIAVRVGAEAAARWRAGRRDRLAAMVDEGWIAIPDLDAPERARPADPGAGRARAQAGGVGAGGPLDRDARAAEPRPNPDRRGGEPRFVLDARSVAEATLFEALEATPATAGRFRLNQSLPVRFGPTAAEIDLLSRGDRIAIEIDGVHHFTDPDRYRRDRRKDLLLQTEGFVVVRLLAEDVVRDVRSAVTVVSQALAYRLNDARNEGRG